MSKPTCILLIMISLALVAPATARADATAPVWPAHTHRGVAPIPAGRLLAPPSGRPVPPVTGAAGPGLTTDEYGPQLLDTWSRVVFQSHRSGNWDIFSMRPDGTDLRQLTSEPSSEGRPIQRLSDGWVAFVSDRGGNFDIYTMAPDGSNVRQVTTHAAEDNYPSWSPDGTQLMFASKRNGNWDIFVMNADGTAVTPYRVGPEEDFDPAWSPDGKWVAWIREGQMGDTVWVSSVDASESKSTQSVMHWAENLAWAPDSYHLAYDYDVGWNGFTEVLLATRDHPGYSPFGWLVPLKGPADLMVGGFSPDGSSLMLSEVSYRIQDDQLYVEDAGLYRVAADGNGPRLRVPGSGLDVSADWKSSDHVPPVATVVGPTYARHCADISWSASDAGGSGVAHFTLRYRLNGGPWQPYSWNVGTRTSDRICHDGGTIADYQVRAEDAARNAGLWDGAGNTARITFYEERYFGRVYDLRETSIPGAAVRAQPSPISLSASAADGTYDAYWAGQIATLNFSHAAYGSLPDVSSNGEGGGRLDVVLPPKTNAVKNGDFEGGFRGWTTSTPDNLYLRSDIGWPHTGEKVLLLVASAEPAVLSASQEVLVPPAVARPTLSFFVRANPLWSAPQAGISVTVARAGQPPQELPLRTSRSEGWTHFWADLSAWGGENVNFTILATPDPFAPGLNVLLDDVVVGEWHTPRITSVQRPASMTGALTVEGENFEPGAVVRLDDTVLATTYVDDSTLAADLPVGIKPGIYALWVTNPGGEEALTSLRVGLPVFLPLISTGG